MFEIAGQLNRGAALIADLDERRRIAELDLAAAKRAKASGAYTSAVGYLTCASELLPADAWESRYALARDICFERASCNLLGASFGAAEPLIVEMRERCTSNVDRSRAYRLHIELAVLKWRISARRRAGAGLLRLFGIKMSPHPQAEEVEAAYALVWEKLGERSIQSLIDLPGARMTSSGPRWPSWGSCSRSSSSPMRGCCRCICVTWWRSRSIGASPLPPRTRSAGSA